MFRNSAGIPASFPRTGQITVYLLVFHRHHNANARVQSSTADDKQLCLFVPISSVWQFCCRSSPTSITGPAAPKTVGVKVLRFFSQIIQVRWPTFSPIPSLSFPQHLFSFFLSHSRLRSDLVSMPEGQPCFCRPIVSARVAASSARPLCEFINVFIHSAGIVSQLLSRVRSASLSANVSFHHR